MVHFLLCAYTYTSVHAHVRIRARAHTHVRAPGRGRERGKSSLLYSQWVDFNETTLRTLVRSPLMRTGCILVSVQTPLPWLSFLCPGLSQAIWSQSFLTYGWIDQTVKQCLGILLSYKKEPAMHTHKTFDYIQVTTLKES